ncbi:(2Fe-2S)-binding protein [Streptomyces yaanensis]|uniref:(2Fe-2S)-binding protein n=1 Tax=Streptomyces yaanensis TaxID=1142239 RepID=A0ABV7S672_9ACTN|nr:(2Fe-2S)-binding protein [Streptomyces sp. CGMCC 4.7035]WNC00143.1 (2Fe-2S)-binding protein [Streptomyces sp. CGMCC 4.7035]
MDLDPELAALRALGGFFALRTGAPPRGPLPTLAQAYAPALSDAPADAFADPMTFRVRKVARSLGAPELRVAASIAHQGLAARLWSVALGCAALHGQVPDLDPGLLHWNPDGSAPDDLWLSEVRALPVESLDAVVREGHLVPLAAAVRSRHRLSARLLWGNAGSALAGSVRMLDHWARTGGRTDVAERARALAAGLLAHPDLAGTLDPSTGRRRSCCLYYRLPGSGLCGDCCFDRPPGRV